MSTELKRFTDAYATMTVAVYEPIVMRWFSTMRLWTLADSIAKRAVQTKSVAHRAMTAAPIALRSPVLPDDPHAVFEAVGLSPERLSEFSSIREAVASLPAAKRRAVEALVPAPEVLDRVLNANLAAFGNGDRAERDGMGIAVVMSNGIGEVRTDFDVKEVR